MKGEICICPKTWARIKFIMRAGSFGGADSFIAKIEGKFKKTLRRKKPRTAKQIRATKKLITFNKRRRARR